MKYLLTYIVTFLLQGCMYFNDRGISANLYAKCYETYDANGKYIKRCDKNMLEYDEHTIENNKSRHSNIIIVEQEIQNEVISIENTIDKKSDCQGGVFADRGCKSR